MFYPLFQFLLLWTGQLWPYKFFDGSLTLCHKYLFIYLIHGPILTIKSVTCIAQNVASNCTNNHKPYWCVWYLNGMCAPGKNACPLNEPAFLCDVMSQSAQQYDCVSFRKTSNNFLRFCENIFMQMRCKILILAFHIYNKQWWHCRKWHF